MLEFQPMGDGSFHVREEPSNRATAKQRWQTYRKKRPDQVQAFQSEGEYTEVLNTVMGPLPVFKGMWIIRDINGQVYVLSDTEFRAAFEKDK